MPAPTVTTVDVFPEPRDSALPHRVAHALDRALRRALAGTGAGATAAVLTDRGSWTGAAGTGLRDERLTPKHAFPYASISKTFTAAEVVLLASRGLVDLHSPVSTYVPLPFQDNGATVEQVLRMRSGFHDSIGETWGRKVETDPDVHITPAEVLAEVPPVPDQAGAPYRYTNTNYLLLGQLIERVTRSSYATALHQDLLNEHGLASIVVQDIDPPPHTPKVLPPPQLAGSSGYIPSRGESSAAWSAGGLAGNAAAAARWGYLLYGGRILRPDLVASMHPLDDGTGYGYGTLTSRSVTSDLTYVGHPGESGPYRTVLLVATDRPLAIAVLAAHPETDISPSAIADELVTALDKSNDR
jgi:D-alanyl-D-alanine carboxypeptidase